MKLGFVSKSLIFVSMGLACMQAHAENYGGAKARIQSYIKAHPEKFPGILPESIEIITPLRVDVPDWYVQQYKRSEPSQPQFAELNVLSPPTAVAQDSAEIGKWIAGTVEPSKPQCGPAKPKPVLPPLLEEPDPKNPGKKKSWTRNLWIVSGAVIGGQLVINVGMSFLPKDTTGWGGGGFDVWKKNMAEGPHFDVDGRIFNYLFHPLSGSEYYLIARNRDLNWWQSTLYAIGGSTLWEFTTEAYYERPSWQDLIVTPIAGSMLGELRYQTRQSLLGPDGKADGFFKKILVIALDPIEALTGGGI